MPVRELQPGVFQITLPTPFAVGDVHTYLLWGDPLTLLDTGVYTPESEHILRASLTEIGIRPADIEQIVLSHSHLDHVGQAQWLRQESGAEVVAHVNAYNKVRDLDAFARQAVAWATGVMDEAGLPADQHITVQAFYAFVPKLARSVRVGRCLQEGDSLRAGGRDWRVLFCPGHSGDLICLYRPEDRLLIGSDHLLAHISSNALLEPPRPGATWRRLPLLEYWTSLDRLDDLAVDTVLTGHGAVITDHRRLLAERRHQRDTRLDRIAGLLATPHDVWTIARTLFPRLAGVDTFLAISEVLGHIDMLMQQGRVQQLPDTMPVLYAA